MRFRPLCRLTSGFPGYVGIAALVLAAAAGGQPVRGGRAGDRVVDTVQLPVGHRTIPYFPQLLNYYNSMDAAALLIVPEFHDCERLILHAHTYGPLACIIPTPGLVNAHVLADLHTASGIGVLEAIAVVADSAPMEYSRIGLVQGINCIAVNSDPGLKALIWTGDPTVTDVCGEGTRPGSLGGYRQVTLNPLKPPVVTSYADIPATTRFEEDRHWEPLFGLRCGDYWCESISPPGAGGMPADVVGHNGEYEYATKKNWRVKGWFDEQHLAIAKTHPGTNLAPVMKSSIIPDDSLGTYQDSVPFTQGRCVNVATIYVRGTVRDKYSTHDQWVSKRDSLCIQRTPGGWVAYTNYNKPALRKMYTVTRHWYPNPVIPIPATARWRWNDVDEDVWVRCGDGCCMVDLSS